MPIQKLQHEKTSAFGVEVTGKLTTTEMEAFLPEMEEADRQANGKFRVLIDVTKMDSVNIKAEWEVFEFFKNISKRLSM